MTDLTLLLACVALAVAVADLAILLAWRPGVAAAKTAAAQHRKLAKDREIVWGWRIDACERRLHRTLEAHGVAPLEPDVAEPSRAVTEAVDALGVEL